MLSQCRENLVLIMSFFSLNTMGGRPYIPHSTRVFGCRGNLIGNFLNSNSVVNFTLMSLTEDGWHVLSSGNEIPIRMPTPQNQHQGLNTTTNTNIELNHLYQYQYQYQTQSIPQ